MKNGFLLVLMSLCVLMTAGAARAAAAPVNVFVSILPQKYLVERIGGYRVHVEVMVKPGLNAETYEPLPRQMAALNKAGVYFLIGIPFEQVWIRKINSGNPGLKIIDCCSGLAQEGAHYTGQGADEITRHAYAAHVWTSPRNAMRIADIMRDTLVAIDPGSGAYYRENHALLVRDLMDLDQFIRQQFATLNNRYLMVAHPSWGFFADAYGLTQIPLERHGTEIRPQELSDLVQLARSHDIHAVYVDKQSSSASARLLARETGARIVVLDPLAEDYINNLKDVARAIAAGGR